MNIIKRLTYRREFRRLARKLHLSKIARKCYYRWLRPRNGILTLEISEIWAQFYIRTAEELRLLEKMGGGGGEQHILELLISDLRTGGVVYDVGSHVGLYTVFLAKVVGQQGQVITFEPESQNYEHLLSNLKLNSLTNVRAFPKALGDQEGQRKLYLGDDAGNASLVQPDTIWSKNYELIELVKGDRFVEAENLPIPRVVKIDVEGYESNVIEGLRHTLAHPACELVCCEIHPTLLPAEVNLEAVLDLLKSLGFGRIDLYPRESEYHAICYKDKPTD